MSPPQSGRRLRILFLTSRFPYPLMRGDQLRAYHQIRLLALRHDVTLLSFAPPSLPGGARAALEAVARQVHTVPWTPMSAAPALARGLFSRDPLQAALFRSGSMHARLRAVLAEGGFDVVHCQLARMAPYLDDAGALPCVVDFVDALSVNMRRRSERDTSPLRWFARLEARRLADYETAVRARAAACVVASAQDAAALGPDVAVSPNGVDLEAFHLRDGDREPGAIVFTGNMGYFSNVEAALWFVREVLPRVRAQVPAAHLYLVGDRPARAVRRLASDGAVIVTGRVEAVRPFLARSAVAVAPTRAGSGQLLKVLEAMAVGVPVVATRTALAGTLAEDGTHVLAADDAADFARAVVRLLQHPDEGRALAMEARRLVEDCYTWERSVDVLERAYLRVVST